MLLFKKKKPSNFIFKHDKINFVLRHLSLGLAPSYSNRLFNIVK